MKKELFINSVRQVHLDGHTVIPTVIHYKNSRHHIGHDAIDECEQLGELLEDFKVELGTASPLKLAQSQTEIGRSTLGITKDFIETVVSKALTNIQRQGFQAPSRILIAEPLSITSDELATEDWLRNYRASIKRILGRQFAQIDFLPEPFAVFQYYRYGVKHPLVAQRTKHIALVFDFGGGTFDASVIETTLSGDISVGGRNSRPLAAKSIPVGGFFINRLLAEHVMFKGLEKGVDKASVRRALNAFPNLKNADDETLGRQRSDHANFVRNYRILLRSIEQAKITICSGISNWKLDANLSSSGGYRLDVPQRPLSEVSPWASIRLEAADIRSIFEEHVWKQRLLPAIRETLKRAAVELDGKHISVLLLSGGTSNIRWLKPLVERDLSSDLHQAQILELNDNFQEIVSKGLAVDCARRFFTEGAGDFRAVTYNRLCLLLDPNENGIEIKRFSPESEALRGIETAPGVLLPSATSLGGLVGEPLQWKVRLTKAPTHNLSYYFMRSSFDPEEYASRHNIDSRVVTPKGAVFSSGIEVELTVREDGTAEPAFIYGTGTKGKFTKVVGTPFYLDMTYATHDAGVETYLGFDFGTSTSSLCYVDGNDIRVYADRASDATWLGLSALTDVLPYPIAYPLQRFLSESSTSLVEHWGRESLEAMLMFAGYVAFAEHCSLRKENAGFFKSFRQRSAGPLWALFKSSALAIGARWKILPGLKEMIDESYARDMDEIVRRVAQPKHGKSTEQLDYPRILEKAGNIIARAMNGRVFGYFEDIKRKPFSMNRYQGIFRNARGPTTTFIDIFNYEGSESFPSEFVFIFDLANKQGIPLFPLITRGLDESRNYHAEKELFVFDIVRHGGSEVAFRAIQERPEVNLTGEGGYRELYESMVHYLQKQQTHDLVSDIALQSRSLDPDS